MKIIIVLAFLIPVSLRAQTAFPDSSGPTSAGCYRLAVPPLTEAPPLHSDMSLSTLLGYLYLDSVMRSHLTSAQWAAFDSIQSFDSLKYLLKYLYAVGDYDPVLLEEYGRDAPFINPGYWGHPGTLVNYVEDKIGSVLTAMRDTTHELYLTSTSYILHIKISNVWRNWDTMANPALPQSCVEAVILDTIKGQHILTGGCSWLYETKRGHNGNDIIDSTPSGSCFHFSYNAAWSKSGSDVENFGKLPGSDSVIFSPDALGWNAVMPDSEYIVFLGVVYEDYDGTTSYFDIRPLMGGGGIYPMGIYPVVGGKVSDPKNLWRMGTSVDLGTFESGLKQTIYKIENP